MAYNKAGFSAGSILDKFAEDLELLCSFLGEPDDLCILRHLPDNQFVKSLEQIGFRLPEFIKLSNLRLLYSRTDIQNYSMHPWGWSPNIFTSFVDLLKHTQNSMTAWHNEYRNLYDRRFALSVLESMLHNQEDTRLISKNYLPITCYTVAHVQVAMERWGQIVLKAPFSSSGRGIQFLRKPVLNDANIRWINHTLEAQGHIMVEPLLERTHDLSFHFYSDGAGGLNFAGIMPLQTHINGRYIGNIIVPKGTEALYWGLAKYELLNETVSKLLEILKTTDITTRHTGFFGIDAFFFKSFEVEKLQPCVELNLRQNMGIVTIKIAEILHPDANGIFGIELCKKENPIDIVNRLQFAHPVEFRDGKLFRGFVLLTPVNSRTMVFAYLRLD